MLLNHLFQILDYTYRDYIHTWYRRISDDEEFGYDIRLTLQRVIIAFSERLVIGIPGSFFSPDLRGHGGSALDHRSLPPEFESWCGHI